MTKEIAQHLSDIRLIKSAKEKTNDRNTLNESIDDLEPQRPFQSE